MTNEQYLGNRIAKLEAENAWLMQKVQELEQAGGGGVKATSADNYGFSDLYVDNPGSQTMVYPKPFSLYNYCIENGVNPQTDFTYNYTVYASAGTYTQDDSPSGFYVNAYAVNENNSLRNMFEVGIHGVSGFVLKSNKTSHLEITIPKQYFGGVFKNTASRVAKHGQVIYIPRMDTDNGGTSVLIDSTTVLGYSFSSSGVLLRIEFRPRSDASHVSVYPQMKIGCFDIISK